MAEVRSLSTQLSHMNAPYLLPPRPRRSEIPCHPASCTWTGIKDLRRHEIEGAPADRTERMVREYSESDADPYSPAPDDAASFSDFAVQKLEAFRQIHHRKYFETSAAGRVIDQSAVHHGQLRAHDDLGLAGLSRRGPNALIQPWELAFCHDNPCCLHRGYGILKGQWLKENSGLEPYPVLIESESGLLISCLNAFSSREPVSTSLENALGGGIDSRSRHVAQPYATLGNPASASSSAP